ncbi:MAG TPA: tRNA (adenosine(37)-N6)-dimethylallyltransferase MiaA [Candidatus Margulisiibacteriota bacterium]|nr:tRNA (adenosine(37)-N6)-dimethylallyltransferase MiaA [Candidatus Margulisiibacteriota bacterium]
MSKTEIIFLAGPTASGKSSAAVKLARKLNAEIISCDSMQVYKGMDIITSKTKFKEHLTSIVSPEEEYDVARFRRDALKKMKDILRKGKAPLFVGGTGLYITILLDGIFKARAEDRAVRERLYSQAEAQGGTYLYQKLNKVDPQAALKIHPNDTRRIVRALEVFEATGKPISQLQKERKGLYGSHRVRIFCLDMPRDKLYQRIDRRVEKMFREGLIPEVKRLLKMRLSRTAQYAIGLKEIAGYLEGTYDLGAAKELMQRNTRNYAKRQLTWFRKDKRIEWIRLSVKDTPAATADKIYKQLQLTGA